MMQSCVYTSTGMVSVTDAARRDSSVPPTRTRRLVHAAFFCAPLVLWVALIALASTNIASEANTSPWIWRLLRLFSPDTLGGDSSRGESSALIWAIRKTAHLAEYAVLGLLAAGALRTLFPGYTRGSSRGTLWRMAAVVLSFGTLVAAIDEWHQTSLPSRTGSIRDVVIDMVGVSAGLLVVWLIGRKRDSRVAERDGTARGRAPDPSEV
jgi:VanZ family protein